MPSCDKFNTWNKNSLSLSFVFCICYYLKLFVNACSWFATLIQ
jgi:hypothetical protein